MISRPSRWLAIASVMLAGCGGDPNELDRDEAKSLVATAVATKPPDGGCLGLRPGGYDDGTAQGYWSSLGLTASGQPLFSSVTADRVCPQTQLELKPEITGIADAGMPGYKDVQFRLSTASARDPVRRFIVSGYIGHAMARRYDDGWRLEGDPSYTRDETPLPLDTASQNALERDLAEEAKRREEADAFEAANRAAFNALVEESRTAKQPYQLFQCDTVIGGRRNQMSLSINDVQMILVGKTYSMSGSVTATSTYLYGHIPSFQVDEDWLKLEQQNAGSGTHFRYFYPKQCANFPAALATFRKNYDAWWKKFDAVGTAQ